MLSKMNDEPKNGPLRAECDDSSSENAELDSDVEVFPFQDSDTNTPESEDDDLQTRAWGNKRNSFYNGNDAPVSDADSLEMQDVDFAEARLSSDRKSVV